jgi:opacity protein-like surface antigen
MNRVQLFVAAAAIGLAAPAAYAQDWTGGYIGAQLGSLSANSNATGRGNDLSYGLHAGYMYELGSGFVLGGELEYDWSDLNLDGVSVDSVGRAKLVAGYNAGVTLPYAVLGAARLDTGIGKGDGWVGGIGIAYKVTPTVALSGEILYHEFKNIGATTVDAEATAVNLRVSYRF